MICELLRRVLFVHHAFVLSSLLFTIVVCDAMDGKEIGSVWRSNVADDLICMLEITEDLHKDIST